MRLSLFMQTRSTTSKPPHSKACSMARQKVTSSGSLMPRMSEYLGLAMTGVAQKVGIWIFSMSAWVVRTASIGM